MIHPVSIIEGIGPKKKESLNNYNVFTTYDIIYKTLDAKINLNWSLNEQDQYYLESSLLFLIPDITKDQVEVLAKNDITVRSLPNRGIENVLNYFREAIEKNLINDLPDEKVIIEWFKQSLRISQNPISILKVTCNDGVIDYSKLKLKINGKELEFSPETGVCIINKVSSWELTAKLMYDSKIIEFLKFDEKKEYDIHDLTLSKDLFLNDDFYELESAVIPLIYNNNIDYQFLELSDFEDKTQFWAFKETNGYTLLVNKKYQVSGLGYRFTAIRAQGDFTSGKLYNLVANSFKEVGE